MNSLYIDMDGVVADFDRYAHQKLGVGPSEGKYPQNGWEILIENPRLYRDLEPTSYASDLYDLCCKTAKKLDYRVAFLTAIPKKNDVQHAMYDKVNWLENISQTLLCSLGLTVETRRITAKHLTY